MLFFKLSTNVEKKPTMMTICPKLKRIMNQQLSDSSKLEESSKQQQNTINMHAYITISDSSKAGPRLVWTLKIKLLLPHILSTS